VEGGRVGFWSAAKSWIFWKKLIQNISKSPKSFQGKPLKNNPRINTK